MNSKIFKWNDFFASLGSGVTWSTGLEENCPGQDWLQVEYLDSELEEIARTGYLVQSLPHQKETVPRTVFIGFAQK